MNPIKRFICLYSYIYILRKKYYISEYLWSSNYLYLLECIFVAGLVRMGTITSLSTFHLILSWLFFFIGNINYGWNLQIIITLFLQSFTLERNTVFVLNVLYYFSSTQIIIFLFLRPVFVPKMQRLGCYTFQK